MIGIIGEFAGGANSVCQQAVQGMIQHLQANTDVWQGALWWGGGIPGYFHRYTIRMLTCDLRSMVGRLHLLFRANKWHWLSILPLNFEELVLILNLLLTNTVYDTPEIEHRHTSHTATQEEQHGGYTTHSLYIICLNTLDQIFGPSSNTQLVHSMELLFSSLLEGQFSELPSPRSFDHIGKSRSQSVAYSMLIDSVFP